MKKKHKIISAFILLALLLATPNALAAPGDTTRVSVATDETGGNGYSFNPSISSDGRYVAFGSAASNLVSGDGNGATDIFVRDRTTDATTRVSVASGGTEGNGYSYEPSISSDGRYVAFDSNAGNLVSGDTNFSSDVFVHDRNTRVTMRVSVATSGTEGNGDSFNPSISSDGRYVTFESDASNLVSGDGNSVPDIFVHDRDTNIITLVSVATGGALGNNSSYGPSISSDGRFVAFQSVASNLVSGDTNGVLDIFVHDRTTGATTRVSVDTSGTQGNGDSFNPSISPNGYYVAFDSAASNLMSGDTNGVLDIFVHDLMMGATARVSVDSSGTQGNNISDWPSISSDGGYVAFMSIASNLVSGDTNGVPDVFVHERGVTTDGEAGNDARTLPKTGFAPNVVTILSLQPAEVAYAELGSLWLEIPSLNVKAGIVGVPQSENTWDVKWLGQDAGWLNGTAFPTWKGNSVITAHVTDSNGMPGPFASLKDLKYGERIIVHLYDGQYIFEIRNKRLVRPETTDFAFEHLEDHSYLTLITCQGYDSSTGSYRLRSVIRAVLVAVK